MNFFSIPSSLFSEEEFKAKDRPKENTKKCQQKKLFKTFFYRKVKKNFLTVFKEAEKSKRRNNKVKSHRDLIS